MISEDEHLECLKSVYKPTNLQRFYNQPSPNKMPQLLICDDKLTKQNDDIFKHITDSRKVVVGTNDNGEPVQELFNVRNHLSAMDLQERYSHNIDIDSELKGINYYDDQCYYDDYKIHPARVTYDQSPLALYKDVVVKDYNKQQPRNPLKCIHLFDKAPQCANENDTIGTPVKHRFNNDNYCKDWNCQKFINNFTNRKMLTNKLPAQTPKHYY